MGSECLQILLAHPRYRLIRVMTRRELHLPNESGKIEQIVVDFDNLSASHESLRADHVFCAIGTTMRQAGSRERFRLVDFEYPRELAALALANGARHLALVSSIGADPRSSTFYSRVKGDLEEAVRSQAWPGATILRPSVIEGPRTEFRPAERVARLLLAVAPRKYRSVKSRAIARDMVALALKEQPGFRVIESRDIGKES